MNKILWVLLAGLFLPFFSTAQGLTGSGQLSGNMQVDFQNYNPDSKIGADSVPEKIGLQSFTNLIYRNKNLEAGLRYETYTPPLQGIDSDYEGHGIAHRYLTYRHDLFQITAGHFYEQFGNGFTLRSYKDWNLGYDNAIDGIRVKLTPGKGITLTRLTGKQRDYWGYSRGTIRGIDGEIYTNDLLSFLKDKKTKIILGGSFVSRYQEDRNVRYKIPENVGTYAGRTEIIHGGFRLKGEYARKINDPSAVNDFIYKPGEALMLESTYTSRGLGITVKAKRIDNMSFKSDYNTPGIPQQINFLPPQTPQHAYELASVYPYNTQPNGEMGINGSVYYMFKPKSPLGGKYGTKLELDYARIHDISRRPATDTTQINEPGTLGYKSDFFKIGDFQFFEDITFSLRKKINRNWKLKFTYTNLTYDPIIKGEQGMEKVFADIGIAEINYRLKSRQSLRMEMQHLSTNQEDLHVNDYSAGDWAMFLLEYNIKDYYFAVKDLYNYRNPSPGIGDIHYFKVSAGVTKGPNRLTISYGRQREGINCVGGVCRPEPAATA